MLFSVIVPVYNVEKYLSQCLDSILAQKLTDYELILVDDGSTDGSGSICDAYANKDNRIQVIHKTNGGLSDARNVGIDKAVGEYIWFIDSDDYLLTDDAFQEVAIRLADKAADVVLYSYKKFFEDAGLYSDGMYSDLSETAGILELIRTNAYKALAWNKVIRSSLMREQKMHFPVGRTSEDLVWCADLLSSAKKIVLCRDDLLAYRQRSSSLTGNKDESFQSKKLNDSLFFMNEMINKYLIDNVGENKQELIGHYLGYEFSWFLGTVYPYWSKYSGEIQQLAFLLQYDLCDKVKKVALLKKAIGLRMTSAFLYRFIVYKNESPRLRKSGVAK